MVGEVKGSRISLPAAFIQLLWSFPAADYANIATP